MNIRYDNGLLFIDIKISYLGKSKLIKNVVIDTGASHTIISPDIVSSIGISASPLDKFITMYGIGGEHYAYRKKIDSISICGMDLKDIEIDFGVIDENGNINGLIGLDVLLELGVSIDLKNLKLKKAQALLKTTDLPISVIADSLGFDDQLAFSKIFKKEYSISPSEYRKT